MDKDDALRANIEALLERYDQIEDENDNLKAKLEKIDAHLDWVEKGIAPCTCDQLGPDYRPCAGCEANNSAKAIRKALDEAKEAIR